MLQHQTSKSPQSFNNTSNIRTHSSAPNPILASSFTFYARHSLSPQAEAYARKLEEKRYNSRHHIQKIVALSEIYGPEKVDRALQDALSFEAYGCEYIANLLEQRARPTVQPGALHLTRRQDLLELELPPADLTPYESKSHHS